MSASLERSAKPITPELRRSLEALHAACANCACTLRLAGELLGAGDRRERILARAEGWLQSARGLRDLLQLDSELPAESTGVATSLRRAWIKVKYAVGDSQAIVAECVRREREARGRLAAAHCCELPPEIRESLANVVRRVASLESDQSGEHTAAPSAAGTRDLIESNTRGTAWQNQREQAMSESAVTRASRGTDRRRAGRAQGGTRARLRLMANRAPVPIWMSGVHPAATWFNRHWREFTGHTVRQARGGEWLEALHPEDRERCNRIYGAAFDLRQPFELECRLRRFDGSYRWMRVVGLPTHTEGGAFSGYIGANLDVSDHRDSAERLRERVGHRTRALRAANERLRQQIDDRRRIEALLAMENHILELIATGTDLETTLGRLSVAVEGLIPNSRCAISLPPRNVNVDGSSSPEAGQTTTAGPNAFGALAKAGVCPPPCADRTIVPRLRPVVDNCVREQELQSYWLEPIVGQGGAIVGTLGIYCREAGEPDPDALSAGATAARLTAIVVERARAEERAREQLAQLAHVARLATMGEMASGLAHELNQPLCAIVNFTEACVELVQRNGNDRAQLSQAFSEVARQAERAGEVIRRLRDFVKRREPERKPVEINAVVREVVAFTSVEARHAGVRVRLRLARRLPSVFADSIQIEQVLVNLVRNACEAMQDVGPRTKELTIETVRRRGGVEVRVSDSGPGIREQFVERLFEPFFTTKREGLGMGLSISRSILEVHEGRLWMTSNRAGGTTFHFTLPTVWRARRGRINRIRSG